MLDTAWRGLDTDGGYDSVEVDITVEADPGDSASYYYSNTVYFPDYHVDAAGSLHGAAYAGIQTNGHSGVDDRAVGKMAIFSAWDGVEGLAETDGWASRFDENGTGYSVRRPFPWARGITYRLRIAVAEDLKSGRLWEATLTDVESGERARIGRIRVDSRFGIRNPVTFHERYAGPSRTVDQIEHSQVVFSNVTAGGGVARARRWDHIHAPSVYKHEELIRREDVVNGVRSTVGLRPA